MKWLVKWLGGPYGEVVGWPLLRSLYCASAFTYIGTDFYVTRGVTYVFYETMANVTAQLAWDSRSSRDKSNFDRHL